jgi:hypothetical protein
LLGTANDTAVHTTTMKGTPYIVSNEASQPTYSINHIYQCHVGV